MSREYDFLKVCSISDLSSCRKAAQGHAIIAVYIDVFFVHSTVMLFFWISPSIYYGVLKVACPIAALIKPFSSIHVLYSYYHSRMAIPGNITSSLPSVHAYIPGSVEVPVAASETTDLATSFFILSVQRQIWVFISVCLKLLFLYLTMAIDKLDHTIINYI